MAAFAAGDLEVDLPRVDETAKHPAPASQVMKTCLRREPAANGLAADHAPAQAWRYAAPPASTSASPLELRWAGHRCARPHGQLRPEAESHDLLVMRSVDESPRMDRPLVASHPSTTAPEPALVDMRGWLVGGDRVGDRVGNRTAEVVHLQGERCNGDNVGAPGRIRTFDLALRRRAL